MNIRTPLQVRPVKGKDDQILFYDVCVNNSYQNIVSFFKNEHLNITLDDARILAERFAELYNTFGLYN